MKLEDRCRNIELVLSDVDGVLTDGGITFDNQGIETKEFHIRDGLGIRLWQRAGFRFGILTAHTSHIVRLRAVELGIDIVRQGFEDKLPVAQQVIEQQRLQPRAGVLYRRRPDRLAGHASPGSGRRRSGCCAGSARCAHLVTQLGGGRGAVRELIETLLKAKNRWDDLIRKYLEQ